MNSLVITAGVVAAFWLAYRFYGRKLESLWGIDPARATPAFSRYDSIDYVPAKNWLVLFGHHFASIAGAGPIIGPVIAAMVWGWLPALLWVVVGTIFIGGVHDFGSLITSVREGGSSISEVALHAISRRAKIIFSLFLWLTLILIIAVFAYLSADTFIKEPRVVVPSLGLIPVAMVVGFFLYNRKAHPGVTTFCGLIILALLIYAGNLIPVKAGAFFWLAVLFIYAYCASVLPVNILLQPRDYLCSFLLFIGMGAGYACMIARPPRLSMPFYHAWSASQEGFLWPALFVTVACGAVSGFHALISSGTSSKQIASEAHARKIGYGGMVTEGLLALLALISVAAFFGRGEDYGGILKSAGPIRIFAQGYGSLTSGLLKGWGQFVAVTILNAFILTTLDTATRISRYLTEELFGIKNRFLSTLLVVLAGGALAASGKWSKIWPAFGASNQLVAALALFVLSCWLLSKKKNPALTIVPAFFMLITTLAALITQAIRYYTHKDILLFSVSLFLIALAAVMAYEVFSVLLRRKRHAA